MIGALFFVSQWYLLAKIISASMEEPVAPRRKSGLEHQLSIILEISVKKGSDTKNISGNWSLKIINQTILVKSHKTVTPSYRFTASFVINQVSVQYFNKQLYLECGVHALIGDT